MKPLKIQQEDNENVLILCPECNDLEEFKNDIAEIQYSFKIKKIRVEICSDCQRVLNFLFDIGST